MAKADSPSKFIVEYKDETGKLESRWHYDRNINPNGPIMTENFNLPKKEKKVAKKKS